MSRNLQVGLERAASTEVRTFGKARSAGAGESVAVTFASFTGADQRVSNRFVAGQHMTAGTSMTRFATGSGLGDWRPHRSEGRYDAGRNTSAAALWGRMIRKGRGGDWENPGLLERGFNRGLATIFAGLTVLGRPIGTAIKTGFHSVPGAVQRGVDKVMPQGLRTATSVLVSGALLVPALAYGYVKGLWQVCQDVGDGFQGNS